MYIPVLLMCLMFIWLAKRMSGRIYNYVSMFNFVWMTMTLLNALNFYNTTAVSTDVWILVLISDIAFSIPGILLLNGSNRNRMLERDIESPIIGITDGLRTKMLMILNCVCIIYLVYRTASVVALLSKGYSYAVIRAMYNWGGESDLGVSAIETMFRMYFITPYIYVLMGIVAVSISNQREQRRNRKNIFILLTSLFCIILNSLATASRIELLLLAFEVAFVWAIKRKRNSKRKKLSKSQKIIILIGVACLLYLTESRGGEAFSITRTIGSYFGLQLHHLDTRLAIFQSNPTYTFGLCLLMGVLRFPTTMLYTIVLHSPYPSLYEYAANVGVGLQSSVSLATDVTFNAFVTPIYYLYVDFGVLGVVIGFAIFAAICSKAYKALVSDISSNRNLMFYMLIMVAMFYVLVRWPFYRPQYLFAYAYLSILYPRRTLQKTMYTTVSNMCSVNRELVNGRGTRQKYERE